MNPTMNMLRHPVQWMFLPLADPHFPISCALDHVQASRSFSDRPGHRRVHREGRGNIVSREVLAHSQRDGVDEVAGSRGNHNPATNNTIGTNHQLDEAIARALHLRSCVTRQRLSVDSSGNCP